MVKFCSICKLPKSLTEFFTDKSTSDLRTRQCKECRKKYKKAHPEINKRSKAKCYYRNIEESRANNREYWKRKTRSEEFRQRERERVKLWRKQNLLRAIEIDKEKYRNNSEKIKARVYLHRFNNLEQERQNAKQRYAANPEKFISLAHKARAKRLQLPGGHWTPEEWLELLRQHGFTCFYCGCKLNHRNITKDHKIPVSRGGNNEISNLVPSCRTCNITKHAKTPEEFRSYMSKIVLLKVALPHCCRPRP